MRLEGGEVNALHENLERARGQVPRESSHWLQVKERNENALHWCK